jgi:selenium metabolism protein YedF
MENLDCRGLACPGPVIQAKKVLEKTSPGGSFSIKLDSEASRDNVRRFAESKGALVNVEEGNDGEILLTITVPSAAETSGADGAERKPPVVLITAETIGTGSEKLGRILMEGFITTLQEQDQVPDRILFLNTGVKLAVQGSSVLDTLEKLTDRGCEILVCGTCLDFFNLKEKLVAGAVSNMYDIQGAMLTASNVINV